MFLRAFPGVAARPLAVVLVLMSACPAFSADAAGVSGKWQIAIPALKRNPTMELTQQGNTLTGTYHGKAGDFPVAGAMDKQNHLTFTVDMSASNIAKLTGTRDATAKFEGALSGNALKGTAVFPNFDMSKIDYSKLGPAQRMMIKRSESADSAGPKDWTASRI